jgi:hypothetical protein
MTDIGTTDSSPPDNRIGRRLMLRRIGSAGLLATAGAGVTSLLGATSARASSLPPQFTNGAEAPGILTPSPAAADCDHCVTCEIAENHCSGGACKSGSCCYYCSGCGGLSYYSCYAYPCSITKFETCPPAGS